MPNQYPVLEFVEKFKEAYHAIDVRAALIKHEDQWRIVCMALRVRIAPPDVIVKDFQQETSNRQINSEKFKITQFCLPFNDFDRLVGEFSKGQSILDGLKIILDSPQDLSKISGNLQSFSRSATKPPILDWPILEALTILSGTNPYYGALYNDSEILRHVEGAGYDNVVSAIKHFLGGDYTFSSIDLRIDIDVPARIDFVAADRTDRDVILFKVNVTAHQTLSDLQCNIFKYKSNINKQPLGPLPMKADGITDDLQCWVGEYDFNDVVDEHETLYFDLIHKNIGRLHWQEYRLRQLFRREVRNPLFAALTHFCSSEQIKDLIGNPKKYSFSISLKKNDTLYEVSIQWLLTCLGFRTIWLHLYEKLKPDNHLYGSIDCIAYHESENILLLVNCTLKTPEQKEIDSYKEVQRYFAEQVFHNTTVRLFSVVFADIAEDGNRREMISPGEVHVFYREDVAKLLELIETGDESRFVDAVYNPGFYRL